MNKKYFLTYILLLILVAVNAQENIKATYVFYNKYIRLVNPRIYDATIIQNKEDFLYTTKLNPDNVDKTNGYVILDDLDFKYKLFKKGNKLYTHDLLQGKEYDFEEEIPNIQYKFTNETKEINGVKLNQATTKFRGREYVIWFKKDKISVSPWKFTGIPGIVYELYSLDGKAKWVLKNVTKTQEKVTNPFANETQFLDYHLYPKKAYGLSEELKKMLAQNPNNKMTEQERTDLETTFEWE